MLENKLESFAKRFKRQMKLMEKFSKQEVKIISPARKTYTKQKTELSTIAKHYPSPLSKILRYENPLLPEDVKTKEQAGKFIRQQVAFIDLVRARFSRHPLIYRPYPEW